MLIACQSSEWGPWAGLSERSSNTLTISIPTSTKALTEFEGQSGLVRNVTYMIIIWTAGGVERLTREVHEYDPDSAWIRMAGHRSGLRVCSELLKYTINANRWLPSDTKNVTACCMSTYSVRHGCVGILALA